MELAQHFVGEKKLKKLVVKVSWDEERVLLLVDIILREDCEDNNDYNLWLIAPMDSSLGKSWGLTELPRVPSVYTVFRSKFMNCLRQHIRLWIPFLVRNTLIESTPFLKRCINFDIWYINILFHNFVYFLYTFCILLYIKSEYRCRNFLCY